MLARVPHAVGFAFSEAPALHGFQQVGAARPVGLYLLIIHLSELSVILRKSMQLRRSGQDVLHVPSARYPQVCLPLFL